METTAAAERQGATIDLSAEVATYFEALRREQARFLETVGQATSVLGQQNAQVAHLCAIQGRLTRQFFDAQRLLLQRRAETDAEVARIAAETEEHANTVLASAVAHAAASQLAAPSISTRAEGLQPPVGDTDPATLLEQSTRQALAALGAMAVRTRADADAFEVAISEALSSVEADGPRMERQLQQLLDDWWTSEAQEGRALLDDARARAAVRLHHAHIEACEIMGAAAPAATVAPSPAPTLLPSSVTEALDRSAGDSLDGVFAALAQSLAPRPVPAAAPVVATRPAPAVAEPADGFQTFWQQEPAPTDDGHSLSLLDILRRIVLPMCAVTSALALALAWIG